MDIVPVLAAKKAIFDDHLAKYIQGLDKRSGLQSACAYSLSAGGKRLRPVLAMLTAGALGGKEAAVLDAALAIEMIHTFSLIHDDLPAIDNDDLRRGRPTCHKAFSESTAILAGDALIFEAFRIICQADYPPDVQADLCRAFAQAAGIDGLVEGELQDIAAEGATLSIDEIESIYLRKTGRLFRLCMYAGARITDGTPQQIKALCTFGDYLGLAFQGIDDILDITSSVGTLGKSIGKDEAQEKATIVRVLGIEDARIWARNKTELAISSLDDIATAGALVAYASSLLERLN